MITGDMHIEPHRTYTTMTNDYSKNAMWLRGSVNQNFSYMPLLCASFEPNTLAALSRGVIKLQSPYIKIGSTAMPFNCSPNLRYHSRPTMRITKNHITPKYDPRKTLIANGNWIRWPRFSSCRQNTTILLVTWDPLKDINGWILWS